MYMFVIMLIYIDSCCYTRPYDNQDQARVQLETLAKLDIQQRVRDGRLDLVVSGFLYYENGRKKDPDVRERIARYMDENIAIYIEDDDPRLDNLIEEIVSTGIKPMDASHLAAAIVAGCDYFITTDDRILKYTTDKIRIMNPIPFVLEVK